MTQTTINFPTTEIRTYPAFLADALITGYRSALNAAEFAVYRRVLTELVGDRLEVVDVVRDENGEMQSPWFTWNYHLYGGECAGGECLEYVCIDR
jgi:hypothetical protein